jgi:acetylornithine deacetylase/succinyl-diaminopimelate desuccinylase-like protein
MVVALAVSVLLAASPLQAPPALEQEEREILDELLRVDTSHGNESAAVALLAARLKAAGVPVQTFESAPGRGSLVARLKGTGAKRPLLLLAQLDVVPVDGQKWESPPLVPTEKDGFLWARGVSDDKSMAAGFNFPGAQGMHQMGAGATDSRFLRVLGIGARGVHSAAGTVDDARKGFAAHGQRERRPVQGLAPGVRYLRDVTLQLAR